MGNFTEVVCMKGFDEAEAVAYLEHSNISFKLQDIQTFTGYYAKEKRQTKFKAKSVPNSLAVSKTQYLFYPNYAQGFSNA